MKKLRLLRLTKKELADRKGKENEKSIENILDPAGVSLPWTWHHRSCPSDPAYGSLLYGNAVLLCKKLGTASYLVYRNRPLQKTSGQFCAEKSHDAWNQMQDHRHGDRSYGHRIYLHEKCACGKNLHSRCVGMPHSVFLPQGKNCGAGGVSSQ